MKKLFIIPILFLLSPPNTGDTFCNVGSNNAGIGTTAWTLPQNITGDDAADAECDATAAESYSQYLVASSFNFSLPAGAIINGITVKIEASEHVVGDVVLIAQLQNETATLFGSSKNVTLSGLNKLVYTYGGTADLWGATLTKAIVEDIDFGVRFWFTTSSWVKVDYVTMAVEYSTYNKNGNFFKFFSQAKTSKKISNI